MELFHSLQDHGGLPILLGVSGFGISVFCGELPHLIKLNHFPWYVCLYHLSKQTNCFIIFLCIIRVRVASVNYKNKNLVLEMLPILVSIYIDMLVVYLCICCYL